MSAVMTLVAMTRIFVGVIGVKMKSPNGALPGESNRRLFIHPIFQLF